jgi:hypothetical protein
MKNIQQVQKLNDTKSEKKVKDEKSLSEIQKKDKLLAAGVYGLIIIITVALMLILFNLIIKS